MNGPFVRDFTAQELEMYKEAIEYIKNHNSELISQLDLLIYKYKSNIFEVKFYLEHEKDVSKKIQYFKQLLIKLIPMNDCDKVKVRVAQPWHPMCWAYYLSKKFKWVEQFIMYGFCVPFLPGKPILLAPYVFNNVKEVKDILAHELTHSLMNTKDLNATNSKDALNDAWTICFLY